MTNYVVTITFTGTRWDWRITLHDDVIAEGHNFSFAFAAQAAEEAILTH